MRTLALALIVAACTAVAIQPAAAAGKPKKTRTVKCKRTQVKVTVAKRPKCVKASKFKAKAPKFDRSLSATRTLVGIGGPKLPAVKLRNGRSSKGMFSAGEQAAVGSWVGQAQQKLRAAAADSARAAGLELGGASASSTGVGARAAAFAQAAASDVKFGEPKVEVSVNPSTGEGTVTGSISGTVELDGGATLDVEVTVGGTIGGASGAGNLSFEVGGTVNEKGKSSSRKTKLNLDQSAKRDTCPDAGGRIEYSAPYSGESSSTDSYKAGPITYGTISRRVAAKTRVRSIQTTMKDDATLPKIRFEVMSDLDMKQQAKVIGIRIQNVSVAAKATATGSLDARSGAIDPGMRLDVNITVKGFSGRDAAAMKATLQRTLEDQVKTLLGELAQHMRTVEDSARGGKCTKLAFNPTTGEPLANDEQAFPIAHLTAPKDGGKDVTPKISWTVTPEVGKASGGEAGASPAQLTVTGAQASPDAARIRVKAVSHTGISEATWSAPARPPFPKTYSGPVSFRRFRDNHGQTSERAGQGTVVYTLQKVRSFDDGSMTGDYDLTTLNVSSLVVKEVDGDCTTELPPYSPGVVPVTDSGLLIRVSPSGSWTYMASAYYGAFGPMPTTIHCTDSSLPPALPAVPVFKFATAGPALGDMRPMSAQGTISGSVVGGIYTGFSDTTGDGTWDLTPGN